MKQLFHLSLISKQAISLTFCLSLFPGSLLSAFANTKENLLQPDNHQTSATLVNLEPQKQQSQLLLAQATTSATTDSKETDKSENTDNAKLLSHSLEFNRSPIVGNRMRLRGVYSEGRLGFTRPRSWNVQNVKAVIRFQHSPALYASRSNLTILVNDTAVGSIPLNRKQSQVGQFLVNIPPKLLQDYNELKIVAQQNNSETCSDPTDPNLWTEILPDSKILFGFKPQPQPLNFSRYPYPFFDNLGLESSKISYLQPAQVSQSWLTSTARLQTSLGRTAEFRPIQTNLATNIADVKNDARLLIVGTPTEQPALADLQLPLKISGSQILNRDQSPIPEDTGVLIIANTKKDGSGAPVLIVTGNSAKAVAKAAQFLVQPDLRKMGTGQFILVPKVQESTTPAPRQWSRYLPEANNFKLSEIKTQASGEPFRDVTVRGIGATPIDIDFRALPDDRFLRGSSMNLVYSYGPQVNPRTSAVEVLLDGVFIGGARLDSEAGVNRKSLKVDLPANLIQPNSKLQVFFRMNSREPFDKERCLIPPDQQLSGTIHSETSFDLKRETSTQLPDLKLLQFGFPFAAPQDLSKTAVVLPQNPSSTEILTLLALSERLGRLSQSDSIKLDVYTTDSLPETVKKNDHLIGIATKDRFPFPEVFKTEGFNLGQGFSRNSTQGTAQTPQDTQGMIKQIISSKNSDRVMLALTAQTEVGLERVRQVLNQDPWFFQLKKDTVLISSDKKDPNPYDPDAYQLAFFDEDSSTKRIENTTLLSKASRVIQENWLLLPVGIIGVSLLLYGIVQLYLKRASVEKRQ
ncbi:cellulose biosynthesis cyclic di-GMP-binding regulatory protein BcsB [Calothrix sp. 336/3]|uniref:cellulose biosynthesis cyclic di-GMP-binding regulatory protein BcsB n=1 Tax=Calothrix sp. 336/3 TaxID=1337936 RepID=UPI0004E41719|nr:cellulose biosynthesis cyclic di-GMP-binding regulatory protein BcsB [Calothrix sp. 336/3]AKG22129.1 cellulose synthase [Calothrix sp. 336/3]